MNRRRNLLSALGLAMVGTLLLVTYVRAAEGRANADEALVPVVVLTADTPKGASDAELRANLEVREVPADARADGAIERLEEVAQQVPAADLFRGEQLLSSRLGDPQEIGGELPEGTVAVTLSLSPERALGGQVGPGTEVNVLASYDDPPSTTTVLRNVVVKSVARSTGDPAAAEVGQAVDGEVLVTLGVQPRQAEALVFAADHGRLWLAGAADVPIAPEVSR